MKVKLREAKLEDSSLGLRLRDADLLELYESGVDHPVIGLSQCILRSDKAWAVTVDGVVEAICGYSGSGDEAVIWAMTSKAMMKKKSNFVKASKLYFEKLKEFKYLHNYVSSANIVHIRWLKKLGFTIDASKQFTNRNIPFYYFFKDTEVNNNV